MRFQTTQGLIIAIVLSSIWGLYIRNRNLHQQLRARSSTAPPVAKSSRNEEDFAVVSNAGDAAAPVAKSSRNEEDLAIVSNAGGGDLYIYVEQWGEGIANWMTSISEILIVAKALNATFVEPCIHKGRLTYCSETHNVKLSDIFRMDKMKEFHPFIVSHEVFQNETNDARNSSTQFQRICHTAHKYLSKCGEGVLNQHSNISSPSLEAAVASAQNSQRTVLQLTSYWKNGWKNMKFKGRPLIPSKGPTVKTIYNKYFHFTQEIYDFVDMILKEAGIKDENYSVIQWRGEIHSLDYVSCARHIITARAIMQEEEVARHGRNETAFVLIAPFNRNESLTWNNRSNGADAQEALKLLLDDNGFLKLDLLVQKHQDFVRDSIFLAAADLVLAQKAKEFATCDKSCNSICAQCGHQGSFVQLAETLRNARDKNSTSCWPERDAGPHN